MIVPKDLAGVTGRFRHVVAQASLALAVVVAAVALSACSGSPLGASAVHLACADRVARAAVVGSVPGLWNCLAPSLQQQMGGTGGDGSLVPKPFATSSQFIGSSAHEAVYELILTPEAAQSARGKYAVVAVWLDSSGKVTAIDFGVSPS